MKIGIYCIHNTLTNTVYIGRTVRDLGIRLTKHRVALKRGDHYNLRMQRAWNKYGASVFEFVKLEECTTPEETIEAENFYLSYFHSIGVDMYNHMFPPYNTGSQGHSEETKAKIGAAFKGKRLTDEHRAKVSRGLTGHHVSPETRAKISEQNRKRAPVSEEMRFRRSNLMKGRAITWGDKISKTLMGHDVSKKVRDKISSKLKGRALSEEHKEKIAKNNSRKKTYSGFVAPDGTIYRNVTGLRHFCKEHGLRNSCMSGVASGKLKTHQGWRRLEKTE